MSLPQPSADFALDALAGDFVASTAAPAVKSACVPTETAPQVNTQVQLKPFWTAYTLSNPADPSWFCVCLYIQLAAGADTALDALSDTLKDITPAPQPAPVPAKDVVKVASVLQEHSQHGRGGEGIFLISGCSDKKSLHCSDFCMVIAGKNDC